MKSFPLVLSTVFALLSSSAFAQSCSDLTVTGDGTPGSTLTFDVTGSSAMSFTYLCVGDTTGTTSIAIGPLGTLELGLALPFLPLPIGSTDANGDVSVAIEVPPAVIPQTTLYAQAFSVDLVLGRGRPTLSFCTSDVESFSVGSSS